MPKAAGWADVRLLGVGFVGMQRGRGRPNADMLSSFETRQVTDPAAWVDFSDLLAGVTAHLCRRPMRRQGT